MREADREPLQESPRGLCRHVSRAGHRKVLGPVSFPSRPALPVARASAGASRRHRPPLRRCQSRTAPRAPQRTPSVGRGPAASPPATVADVARCRSSRSRRPETRLAGPDGSASPSAPGRAAQEAMKATDSLRSPGATGRFPVGAPKPATSSEPAGEIGALAGLERRLTRNDNPRNPATTQADGVGFEPTNDFRRCRFSRSAEPLGVLPIRTPRKQGRNAPEVVLAGTTSIRPERRNRDNPRHHKPNRDHSPDKSATSHGRRVSKSMAPALGDSRGNPTPVA